MTLLSFHNVHFLMDIARMMRRAIVQGRFEAARKEFFAVYKTRASSPAV